MDAILTVTSRNRLMLYIYPDRPFQATRCYTGKSRLMRQVVEKT